jgi:phosphoglycerol transferase MdoB-like AlkP superfamily enzyme
MSQFFPVSRGDRWYLALLIALAVVAFLPWSRATAVGTLPLFGWLMVALMVLAPAVALVRLLLGNGGEPGEKPR